MRFKIGLKLIKSGIWQMFRIWQGFMICIPSRPLIEELDHIVTTPRGLIFFILLGCYYILLSITDGLWELTRVIFGSMILVGLSWNYSSPSKGVSMILWWKLWYVSLPDRIEPIGSYIKGAWPDQWLGS